MYKRYVMLFLIYFFILRPSPTRILGDSIALHLFNLISVLLVLIILIITIRDKSKSNIKFNFMFSIYLILFLWSVLSLIITYYQFDNTFNMIDLLSLTKYLYFFLLLIVGYNISNYIGINTFLKHLFIATLITILISFLQFYNPLGINNLLSYIYNDSKLKDVATGNPRVFGTLYNANWFGVYLSFIISIASGYLLIPKNKDKLLKVLAFIVVIMASFGILISGSRTAIIVSIIALVIIYILSFINKPSYKIIILPILLSVVIGISFLYVDFNVKRFDELVNLFKSESTIDEVESASGRLMLMEEGLDIYYENPIIGVGPSSATDLNAHNSYITLLYRHGIIGLLLVALFYIIYYFHFAYNFKKTKNNELKYFSIGVTGGITAFLTASLLGEYMNSIQVYSIVLLTIGIIYGYYNKKQNKLNETQNVSESVLKKRA